MFGRTQEVKLKKIKYLWWLWQPPGWEGFYCAWCLYTINMSPLRFEWHWQNIISQSVHTDERHHTFRLQSPFLLDSSESFPSNFQSSVEPGWLYMWEIEPCECCHTCWWMDCILAPSGCSMTVVLVAFTVIFQCYLKTNYTNYMWTIQITCEPKGCNQVVTFCRLLPEVFLIATIV